MSKANASVPYGEFAEILGESLALELSQKRGGRQLYIPRPDRLTALSPVAALMGMEAAQKLSASRLGGTDVVIPIGPGKRGRVWQLRDQGWTQACIAAEMRCHVRTVQNILGGTRPRGVEAPPEPPPPPLLALMIK